MPPLFRADRPARVPVLTIPAALMLGITLGAFFAFLQAGLAYQAHAALRLSAPPMAAGVPIGGSGGTLGDAAGGGTRGVETRTVPPPPRPASSPPPPPPSPPPPPPPSPPPAPRPPPPPPTIASAVPLEAPPLAPSSYASISGAVAALAAPLVPGVPGHCHARPHSDFGGELAGGAPHGDANLVADAGACCAACGAHAGTPRCNVWVYNTVTRACWLKVAALYPERPYVYFHEESVWTAGSLFDYGPPFTGSNASGAGAAGASGSGSAAAGSGAGGTTGGTTVAAAEPPVCIHTVLTSNGNSCARPRGAAHACACALRCVCSYAKPYIRTHTHTRLHADRLPRSPRPPRPTPAQT
jgi:hypothetical protein